MYEHRMVELVSQRIAGDHKPIASRARQHGRDFPLPFRARVTHKLAMPIRPEHRWLYPIDWPELSRLLVG